MKRNSIIEPGKKSPRHRGWYKNELKPREKKRLLRYLGEKVPESEIPPSLVRLAMMSVANTAIFPIQDILGLGQESRMNNPTTGENNWLWRLQTRQLKPEILKRFLDLTRTYGRA